MYKTPIIIVLVALIASVLVYRHSNQFAIPSGETQVVNHAVENMAKASTPIQEKGTRELLVTDGVTHSIPLNEILAGGPPKDGIPSIDDPIFVSAQEAESFLPENTIGLGLNYNGEQRFYPYPILVWHEIVNDVVNGKPVLVTYCPLCATGVVFDPTVNGSPREFGVSGRLWQSNLLMYDRTGDTETESLWSQVLGEAVLGPETGTRLAIIRSDTVLFSDWVAKHPNTRVLSEDTGAFRNYGSDPYGDYYTDTSVSFGATFNDDRLHPKRFVLGIEIDGSYKAYDQEALPTGETIDTFNGETITITKSAIDEVTMSINGKELSYIGGFWFSWLAVHPDTELWTQ